MKAATGSTWLFKALGLVALSLVHGASLLSQEVNLAWIARSSTPRKQRAHAARARSPSVHANLAAIERSFTERVAATTRSPASPPAAPPKSVQTVVEEVVTGAELAGAAMNNAAATSDAAASRLTTSLEPAEPASKLFEDPSVDELLALEEDMRERARRPAPSQGLNGGHFVHRWEIPDFGTLHPTKTKWPDWVFDDYDDAADLEDREPPAFAEIAPPPLFYVHRPRETEIARKVKKLIRNKLFREVRRHTKRQWKRLFEDSPTMSFTTYEETLAMINHIGKSRSEVDEFNDDYRTNETRDHLFQRRNRRGEPDIPLLTWGPLTVTDSGEVRFDVGRAAADDEEVAVESLELGGKKAKPLFSSKDYKLNTSFRLHVNPTRYQAGGNYVPFLDAYGVEMEVEWLSDILGREMVSAEVEVEFDRRGEVAAFVNFVIKSRS